MKIYIDGTYYDRENAKISVFDHGLLYGDGIFEGIRAYNGRVFHLKEHLERLYDSAKAIMLTIPMSFDDLQKVVVETCRLSNVRDGYIRLVVTRGVGNLGLSPDKCLKATIFCIADTIQLYPPEYYEKGLRVNTSPTQRIPQSALSPSVKSLNYLNNILAKIEGNLYGAQESIMLNHEGYVAECTGDNIFVLKKGLITTPPIWAGALGGVTRKVVIDLARQSGREVQVDMLTRYDLFVADEIFLTGTGAEIVAAVEVDGRIIGNGKPGPITQDLVRRYRDLTQMSGVPIYQ
jgi:branched-chain amino acid aminotransferase